MTLFGGVTQLHPNEYAVRERSAALGVGSASEEVSGRVGEASEHCRQSGKGERERQWRCPKLEDYPSLLLSSRELPILACTHSVGGEATKEGAKLSPAKIAPRITRGAPKSSPIRALEFTQPPRRDAPHSRCARNLGEI